MSADLDPAALGHADRPPAPSAMSLRDFLLFCRSARWIVAATCAACVCAAVIASLVWTPEYEASVLLYPVSTTSSSGGLGALGSAMSELGGLASLTGLNLNGDGGKQQTLATLQAESLTERYIQENNLLPVLFSSKWDPERKAWKVTDPKKIPTLWKGNQYFKHNVRSVEESSKTGLITLTITWKDPVVAAHWANDLMRLTNDYLRQQAIEESERNIAYLTEQAEKTNVVEVRTSIYTLMESEIKKGMLARGSKEYALKVIDPATPPEKESAPRPLLWTAGALVLGIMLGLLVAVLRQAVAPSAAEIDPLRAPLRRREPDLSAPGAPHAARASPAQ